MGYSSNILKCPSCRSSVSAISLKCPNCHSKITKGDEPGIMDDEKVPQKVKSVLKYAPLICSIFVPFSF